MEDDQRRIESSLPAMPIPPIERLHTIEESMRSALVPGASVAVFQGREIAWSAGYGTTTANGVEPITPETIFQACSISKAVAAVAAMRLVQDGILDLDEDVNERLRSWRIPANAGWQPRVTLRQLLSHSAALTAGWYPGYQRGSLLPSFAQVLDGLPPANTLSVRVTGVPGLRFRYSGSNFSVVQQLLEDVTSTPFNDLLRQLVFTPLDMRHSSYDQAFPEAAGIQAAHGHDEVGDEIAGGWRLLPEMAAAGLWTTPSDLARIAIEMSAAWHGAGTILTQENARLMMTRQVGNRCLGWQVDQFGECTFYSHGGDNIGYKCRLIFDIERGDGIAVMTNADLGTRVVTNVVRAAADTYGWPLPKDRDDILRRPRQAWPDFDPTDQRLARYQGTFVTEEGRQVELIVGSAITLNVPGQPPLTLHPIDAETFGATDANILVSFSPDDPDRCVLWLDGADVTARRVG